MTAKLSHHRLPELDGVRAIAVILILLHHAKIQFFENGWIGVPIFFVLSGFLVTGILLDSLESVNYYTSFYIRRALRIAPIYYLLLITLTIFHALFFQPNKEFIVYFFYLQNFQLSRTSFAETFLNGTFNHTWSLAIEAQFYLIWPFVVRRLGTGGVLIATPFLVLSTFSLRILLITLNLQLYSCSLLPTCLDTLGIGAFLAALVRSRLFNQHYHTIRFLIPILISLIFSAYFIVVHQFALIPVWTQQLDPRDISGGLFLSFFGLLIGIILLILIQDKHYIISSCKYLLSIPPLRYISKISYGLYLYHYPIFSIFDKYDFGILPSYQFFIKILLAFSISALSWHFIEQPLNLLKKKFPLRKDNKIIN